MNKHASFLEFVAASLLTGLLFYFAIDLKGNFGWLLWVAPLPLLLIAPRSKVWHLFICAFVGYLIGRMNWVPFLMKLMPTGPVFIISIIVSLLFALLILGARRIMMARNNFLAVLAYPVLLTAGEFLSLSFSYDGTAGSLAYSQSNYLAIIQVASLAGIWGILFVVSLIPSTIAIAWHLRSNRKQMQWALLTGSTLILAALIFGWVRLSENRDHTSLTVGMTVVPEPLHLFTTTPVLAREEKVADAYIRQIEPLAQQGAKVVLFPEKTVNATVDQKDSLLDLFKKAAVDSKVIIAGGITVDKPHSRQNLVEFVLPNGTIQEYKKVFHVKGFEDGYERGTDVGFLMGLPTPAGMAICKDMDYPSWIRNYCDVNIVFVPAWDFVSDGWLHCRMAVMRGVENGFTVVRAARQGRLTVSDYRGKILSEANCEKGQAASLLGEAPIYSVKTLYSSWGEWFGMLCLFVGLVWLVASRKRK